MKNKILLLIALCFYTSCSLFSPRDVPEPADLHESQRYNSFGLDTIFKIAAIPVNYGDISEIFTNNFQYFDFNTGNNWFSSEKLINEFDFEIQNNPNFSVSWNDSSLYLKEQRGDTITIDNLEYQVSFSGDSSEYRFSGKSNFIIIKNVTWKISQWHDFPYATDSKSFFAPSQ